MNDAAKLRLRDDFAWPRLAEQTAAVYDRVWSEFMQSYWVEDTLWPVSPGAEQRAEEKHIREKAEAIATMQRPMPAGGSILHRPEELDEVEIEA